VNVSMAIVTDCMKTLYKNNYKENSKVNTEVGMFVLTGFCSSVFQLDYRSAVRELDGLKDENEILRRK